MVTAKQKGGSKHC